MVVVFIVNSILGSNYLFIMEKSATASLMDFLGPWPWYIHSLELLGFTIFLILYSPFATRDWKAGKVKESP